MSEAVREAALVHDEDERIQAVADLTARLHCPVGCDSGACETCACCSAGWCVFGIDGWPETPEDRESWLEVAKDHNPVAAALDTMREALRKLADACALTLPGSALSNEIDEGVQRATELVGPMQ